VFFDFSEIFTDIVMYTSNLLKRTILKVTSCQNNCSFILVQQKFKKTA